MTQCEVSVYHWVRRSKLHKRQAIATPASSFLSLPPLKHFFNLLLPTGGRGFAGLECLVFQELSNLLNVGLYGGHVWIDRYGAFEPFERLTGFFQTEVTQPHAAQGAEM
jgi:hypothetical protein